MHIPINNLKSNKPGPCQFHKSEGSGGRLCTQVMSHAHELYPLRKSTATDISNVYYLKSGYVHHPCTCIPATDIPFCRSESGTRNHVQSMEDTTLASIYLVWYLGLVNIKFLLMQLTTFSLPDVTLYCCKQAPMGARSSSTKN